MMILLFVLIIYVVVTARKLFIYNEMRKNWVLSTKTEILRKILIYSLLWPYYTFALNSPLTLFSETFFKNYGDKGRIYLGNKGVYNFLRDIFYGKDRYKDASIIVLIRELDESCPIRQDDYLAKDMRYMELILGKQRDSYFYTLSMSQEKPEKRTPSRYTLDQCYRLTKEELYDELTVNVGMTDMDQLLSNLSDKIPSH